MGFPSHLISFNDLEWCTGGYFALFHRCTVYLGTNYIAVVEARPRLAVTRM